MFFSKTPRNKKKILLPNLATRQIENCLWNNTQGGNKKSNLYKSTRSHACESIIHQHHIFATTISNLQGNNHVFSHGITLNNRGFKDRTHERIQKIKKAHQCNCNNNRRQMFSHPSMPFTNITTLKRIRFHGVITPEPVKRLELVRIMSLHHFLISKLIVACILLFGLLFKHYA
ncbi:hypothetical protein Hanom_Chr15g01361471 [Helianthus anomalus]